MFLYKYGNQNHYGSVKHGLYINIYRIFSIYIGDYMSGQNDKTKDYFISAMASMFHATMILLF